MKDIKPFQRNNAFLIGCAVVLLLIFTMVNCSQERPHEKFKPPIANKIPKKLTMHGHTRIDNYYWLRERDNTEVIEYLEAENDYVEKVMTHTEDLQAKLMVEFRSLEEQTDQPIPYRKGDYLYYARYDKGGQYAVYCRKKESIEADEEVLLDADRLAEGYDFFALGPLRISPGQDILAYGVDTTGNRDFFTIYLKDLKTGELLPDVIPDANANVAWANDNGTLFYVRNSRAYSHRLETDPSEDRFLLEDISYLMKTKSTKYILIFSARRPWEWRGYLDADNPMGHINEIVPPRPGQQCYRLEHSGDKFYFLSSYQAPNFCLMKIPVGSTGLEDASVVVAPREDVDIENLEVFKDHLVLQERKNGLTQLHIISLLDGKEHYVDFGEPVYSVSAKTGDYVIRYSFNHSEINSHILRYKYSSMTTPESIYDYNMVTRKKVLVSQEEVGHGFDSSNYQSERLWAAAEDGTLIPISLVHRKGIKKDGENPLLLEGYGMYGSSQKAGFIGTELSLLDRGFIYAIAHVRGGGELGQRWHREGKLLKKKNSFTDFIACAQYLVEEGYTRPERLFARGSSGGGLLMAGVVTMAPELFKGVIIKVPYVDIISMILDPTLPYSTDHYDELGNPNNKEYYEYMLSYAPYDNIEAREYPNLLVTAGFLDTHVQYWPAAKLVAKLRAMKTDQKLILLKTYMTTGHDVSSGRLERFREIAFECAFLLELAGIRK